RVTAAEILGRFRKTQAVRPLVQALSDSSPELRMRCVESLGMILKDALPELLAKLKGTNELVRVYAAEAVEQIGDPRALPELRRALQDTSPIVRSSVASALAVLGTQKDIKSLSERLKAERSER